MITEADLQSWKPADLRPYIDAALEAFTPQHCMYGSDWPVCLLAGSYADMHAALASNVASLSAGDREWLFGRTAAGFYDLPLGSSSSMSAAR